MVLSIKTKNAIGPIPQKILLYVRRVDRVGWVESGLLVYMGLIFIYFFVVQI